MDAHWGERPPPETEEQKKARANWNFKTEERRKATEEYKRKIAKGQTFSKDEEEKKAIEDAEEDKKIAELWLKCKPKAMIKVPLAETSIHDLLISMDRMAQYDRLLSGLGYIKTRDWKNEDKVLAAAQKPFMETYKLLSDVEPADAYSTNPEIQRIVEKIEDQ